MAQAPYPGAEITRRCWRARRRLFDRFTLLGAIGVALGLALWVVLTTTGAVPTYALPSPTLIADRFVAESDYLLGNIGITLVRVLVSFTVGSAAGTILAIAASWNETIDGLAEPIIQILKPVPPLVLSPFMIIWFGAGEGGVIALALWGAFFLMVVEGREALRRTPVVYRWSASTLGDSSLGVHLRVMLPSSVPRLIGALRITLVLTVNLVILGEFFVAAGGIGEVIVRGYRFLRPDQLFFGIIVALAMASLLDVVIRMASIRLRRWV